jgi:hypothetical protein
MIESSPLGGTFRRISTGLQHTCGIRDDDTVGCWGSNGFGQLDAPGGTFKRLAAGGEHVCGVKTDDTLECWGLDNEGQATPP